ncbi:MAG TPA: VacJ family lipoprotein [Stellaceae bacterium]|nr:VacJ family lipoprotein [Stellaceae bacterium]
MPLPRLPIILAGIFAAGLALSGCAAPGAPGAAQVAAAGATPDDPYEDTNRALFAFNQNVDRNVLVPVAEAYRTVLPGPVRQSLHDFLRNLDGPVILVNDVLQGQLGLAGNTLARLVINTTIGFGGLFDVATHAGIPYHSNDLGVTLATWGIQDGPYIIIPVLGPSNVRDLAGQVGDSFADPADYVAGQHHLLWAAVTRSAVSGIDERSRNIESLADIEKTSLDYYATIRSLYRQRRQAQIRHEKSNLPNPGIGGGSDSGPEPFMSYTVAPAPAAAPGAAPAPPASPRSPPR